MQPVFPSSPIVAVERRIVIQAPVAAVFAFAADLRHDALWRQEINGTELDTDSPAVGSIAVEDAHLSAKSPHALTYLAYVAYQPGSYMRCTAVAGSSAWTEVERSFRPTGPRSTEFTYRLRFERRVVELALGFAPPLWFLRWYSGWMMERYLRRLKHLHEKAATEVRPSEVARMTPA